MPVKEGIEGRQDLRNNTEENHWQKIDAKG